MREKIVDVRTEGDVATIRYREDPEVDRDMMDEVSACEPHLPGAASPDGEARRRYRVISLAAGVSYEAAREGIHGLSIEAIDGRPEDDLTAGMHFVQASED
ncbi:hypothetical protein WME89_19430 [Sorangium sp. So ce321]|uniref:hypothetical protein n=1 Tax=Sorangium sp. So ce321 TaxID=3133300 RepID=UPI003F61B3AC